MRNKKNSPSGEFIIATTLTVAYLIFIWLAVDVTTNINDASRNCVKSGWLAPLFGCLTLNELGDFLAGAFAPLAFFWLAAAVLIQSKELKAQRNELELTRESVNDNREVMKAQAAEARKQAEYIGKQTEILEREQQRREGEERIRIFKASVRRLAARIKENQNFAKFASNIISPDTQPWDSNIKHFSNDLSDELFESGSDEDIVRETSCVLVRRYLEFEEFCAKEDAHPCNKSGFFEVFTACEKTYSVMSKIPSEARIESETLGLVELMETLRFIDERLNIVANV